MLFSANCLDILTPLAWSCVAYIRLRNKTASTGIYGRAAASFSRSVRCHVTAAGRTCAVGGVSAMRAHSTAAATVVAASASTAVPALFQTRQCQIGAASPRVARPGSARARLPPRHQSAGPSLLRHVAPAAWVSDRKAPQLLGHGGTQDVDGNSELLIFKE